MWKGSWAHQNTHGWRLSLIAGKKNVYFAKELYNLSSRLVKCPVLHLLVFAFNWHFNKWEKGISIYTCKFINSFSNCSEVIIVFIMQIFHPLKTSLFLVLTPALVRCSVVSLSYSWDFLTPQVRNVAQLVLQKKKFKSFIVMTDTYVPLFSKAWLADAHLAQERAYSLPKRAGMYSNSKEQQKSSMLFSPSQQYNHKNKNIQFWYSYAYSYVRPVPLVHSSFYAYACALVTQRVLHTAKQNIRGGHGSACTINSALLTSDIIDLESSIIICHGILKNTMRAHAVLLLFLTLFFSVEWKFTVPFCGVPEIVLVVACCGVGGAEIDGTTGEGERRLWFLKYCGLLLVSLPARKKHILYASQICTKVTKKLEKLICHKFNFIIPVSKQTDLQIEHCGWFGILTIME